MRFKTGDVIELKSGSTRMTVTHAYKGSDGQDWVSGKWFNHVTGKFEETNFLAETVQLLSQ